MSKQAINLTEILQRKIEDKKQNGSANNTSANSSSENTENKLNARVGEARGSIHIFNSKSGNNYNRDANEYRGVIGRTWFLGNPQTYASF